MAFKFFNIGKANAEIDRLNVENAALKAANPSADSAQLSEALASNDQISAQLTQANSDLVTARAEVTKLNGQLSAQVESHKTEMKNLSDSVGVEASKKALEITAKTGAPPAPSVPAEAKQPASKASGMARILSAAKADLKAARYVSKTVSA